MEKECCSVKVVEVDNGLRVEITGDKVKENAKSIIENCRSGNCCAEFIKKCCSK